MVRMATELVLLGTAGAPLPVPGRTGIVGAGGGRPGLRD
jgi:hypothetical protein